MFLGRENVHNTRPWHLWLATLEEVGYLDRRKMILCRPFEKGDGTAADTHNEDGDARFVNYVVLMAKDEDMKHGILIGWIMVNDSKAVEIHRRVIHAPTRVIIGPYGMMFFGIRPKTGEQAQVYRASKVYLSGKNLEHAKLILI